MFEILSQIPAPQLWAFIAGGLVVNFAPGPDVFFASACGLQNGPRGGALAGLGVGLGVVMHLILAVVGLGAIVAAHPAALSAVKYVGAAYLLYLAWQAWTAGPVDPSARAAHTPLTIVKRGFLSNALNPKPVLFLLSFLPQFTQPEYGPIWQQILSLGLVFVFTGTLVTIGFGVAAGYAGAMLGRRLRALNRVSAVMFGGLAVALVAK